MKMWVEKYRPQKFDDVIALPKQFRSMVDKPTHLLLVGKAGCGKTTCARIFANELGAEILEKNASDDRGISVIREQVKFFCQKKSLTRKVIFLDEADGLTNDAQQSLRRIMEIYSVNTIFILTANYRRRIIEPLESRCAVIEFPNPERDDIIRRLKDICNAEKIEYKKSDIAKIVDKSYPDIRKAINILQSSVNNGRIDVESIESSEDVMDTIYDLIKTKKFTTLRELVETYTPDYDAVYHHLFWKIFNDEGKRMDAMLEIAERMYRNQSVSNPTINFMACAFKLSGYLGS